MDISVVIASRDRKACLLNLLNDLKRQELTPGEIVVVDQSTTAYDLDGCVYVRDEGVGPCRARNRGAAMARGEVLVFLDDDVRIEPGFLKLLCQPILEGRYAAATGAPCNIDGEYLSQEYRGWLRDSPDWINALTENPMHSGSGLTLSFAAGCSAVLKSVFTHIGEFDIRFDPNGYGEDREIALRLFHWGYPIWYCGSARIFHLGHVSGGRRNTPPSGDLKPNEAAFAYIVSKYFGKRVLAAYTREWLIRLIVRNFSLNPSSWWRSYRKCHAALQLVKTLEPQSAIAVPRAGMPRLDSPSTGSD